MREVDRIKDQINKQPEIAISKDKKLRLFDESFALDFDKWKQLGDFEFQVQSLRSLKMGKRSPGNGKAESSNGAWRKTASENHQYCPDGFLRPIFEAVPLWNAHHTANGQPDLVVETPEDHPPPDLSAETFASGEVVPFHRDAPETPVIEQETDVGVHWSKPAQRRDDGAL